MREAAHQSGISLVGLPLEGTIQEAKYRRAFELMKQERADALIVADQAENNAYSLLIIELAEESRLPVIFPYANFAKQSAKSAFRSCEGTEAIVGVIPTFVSRGAKSTAQPVQRSYSTACSSA
jgi:hypothetical protein